MNNDGIADPSIPELNADNKRESRVKRQMRPELAISYCVQRQRMIGHENFGRIGVLARRRPPSERSLYHLYSARRDG